MWKLETQLFASSYIWLVYIFEASYSTVATSVSKKASVDQSELEKQVVPHCETYYMNHSIDLQSKSVTDFFMIRTSLMNELRFIQRIHRVNWIILKSDPHTPNKLFYLLQWKPFRTDDKCFLFHLKRFFCSQDI